MELNRRVRPTPSDAYLGNPHKGCCTFQHFNGDPLFSGTTWSEHGPLVPDMQGPPPAKPVIDGYLPTTVSYCRWYWETFEAVKGQYDFSAIERALEVCRERGQTLAVRLMAHGSGTQGPVPEWYSKAYPMAINRHKKVPFMAPVYETPEYFEHWGNVIREFGRRFDGNPLLETIDVTYIGPWGEGAGECSPERCDRFARLFAESFPKTPRLALIGGDQMRASVALGAGWRCDCYGDLKWPGSTHVPQQVSWNHHYDVYPREVVLRGAQDAWKTAPVHFETCWVPMYWYVNGFDLDFILQQGLKFHGTYFMPKYSAMPAKWMDRLLDFSEKLGYRFILRQAEYSARAKPGEKIRFRCWIENVGVAPIYRPYRFALRLRQDHVPAVSSGLDQNAPTPPPGREVVIPFDNIDIRTWMPGDAWLELEATVPANFRPGYAELSAALVDDQNQARVRFAIKEQYADRWADLGGVEILP